MANRIVQTKAKLLKNIEVANNYYKILVSCPQVAKAAEPGQFVNIKVSEGLQPLLRRPLGIHGVRGQTIEILYESVGKGTELLSKRRPGEYLDVVGPLGNGFGLSLTTRQLWPILVAGGMGVAPLTFLAEKLREIRNPKSEIRILIGAKTKSQILCVEEFRKLGCEVKIATDDGSKGYKGKVTDLLKNLFFPAAGDRRPATIYACGPRLMLKEISRLSLQYKIAAQISLEEHMACGIGACLGCAVNTKDGYKRVCKEGPVFEAKEIIW
ncbi:MAG: dihydroorotate dehydrogenase electron transfer subunit [Candidatus Omnitrophota bacterium]